jgi:preprotein translocase subunit SecG
MLVKNDPTSALTTYQLFGFRETFIIKFLVVFGSLEILLLTAQHNHGDGGGTLGGGGFTQVFLGRHKHIRHIGIFAEHRQMSNHINGRNVTGDNNQALFTLSESLANFLDTTTDVLGLAG